MAINDYDDLIESAGREWNVDPALLKALMRQESNGNPSAQARDGGQGLMQIMPETQRALGIDNPFDPVQSVYGGAKYLSQQLDRYGNPVYALAAYNAGPGAVDAAINGTSKLPDSTVGYVGSVANSYKQYQAERAGGPTVTAAAASPPDGSGDSAQAVLAKLRSGPAGQGVSITAKVPTDGGQSDDDFLSSTAGSAPAANAKTPVSAPPSPAKGDAKAGVQSDADFLSSTAGPPPKAAPPPPPPSVPVLHPSMLGDYDLSQPGGAVSDAVGGAVSRIGSAIAQGAQEGFGQGPLGLSPQTQAQLARLGIYPPNAQPSQGNLLQNLNQAFINPLSAGVDLALRTSGALLRGGQGGVAQLGAEVGQPVLGRDIAAIPEAIQPGQIPGRIPSPAQVRSGIKLLGPPDEVPPSPPPSPPPPPGASLPRILDLIRKDDAAQSGNPPPGTPSPAPGQPGPATGAPAPAAPPTSAPPGTAGAPNLLQTPPQVVTGPRNRFLPIVTQGQADAEADRILQHFGGGNVTLNTDPLPSGATPTLSQSVVGGNAGLSGLERAIREGIPSAQNAFMKLEAANQTAREDALQKIIGTPADIQVAQDTLDSTTAAQRKAVFDPGNMKPTDPSAAVSKIAEILGSDQGQRTVVADSLTKVLNKIVDKDGNLQTDPLQLYGIRQDINDSISPKAAGTASDARAAARQLMAVRGALDSVIEQGAPGFQKYISTYSDGMAPIDGMRYLQNMRLTDANGKVQLGKLNSSIDTLQRQQALPGARLADGVTDDQLTALKSVRDEFRNDQKQKIGAAIGSPTVQKLGANAIMANLGHPVINALTSGGIGIGIHPSLALPSALAGYGARVMSSKGQAMVQQALLNKLINPDMAQSAFPRPILVPPRMGASIPNNLQIPPGSAPPPSP